MATRQIPGRISEATLSAEGILTLKVFDEDPALYNSSAIGDAVNRTGFPNQSVALPSSTLLRLMDIPTLRDEDDGPGFYAAVRGILSNWNAAVLMESDDDTADFRQIKTFDQEAAIGFANTKLAAGPENVWDSVSTVDVQLIGGGALESFSSEETLKGRVAYLLGSEIILCQNVTQLSALKWRLNGPLVRGYKGTEWAIKTHVVGERFVELSETAIRRINDTLADLYLQRSFKAVTSGQAVESAATQLFTDTGVSLKPWSPVDIEATLDGSDNVILVWKRRSRLQGRNGRDFFDPLLGEASESYEIDILSDDETTVKRTLTATSETVSYTSADQVTDFGAVKTANLHGNIYQISAAVGRGYAGHFIVDPSGVSGAGYFDLLWPDGNPFEMQDGNILEFQHG